MKSHAGLSLSGLARMKSMLYHFLSGLARMKSHAGFSRTFEHRCVTTLMWHTKQCVYVCVLDAQSIYS